MHNYIGSIIRNLNLISFMLALFTAISGYIFGYRQGKTARKSLDLNLTKAIPKIATGVILDKRQINPVGFPPHCFVFVAIHNEGELPAEGLKGNCGIYSPTNGFEEFNIPIIREYLGPTPYRLESGRLDERTGGMAIDPDKFGNNFGINVDVEFHYTTFAKKEPQRYKARHQYDYKNGVFNLVRLP
jgi:hypothetical protein